MASSSYFNIYVTHVVGAIDLVENVNLCNLFFWGQRSREQAIKFEEKIMRQCSFELCPAPTPSDLKKGKLVCVLVNGNWMRAKVLEMAIDGHGSYIDVFCLDYGIMQSIPLNFVKAIPPNARIITDLNQYPPFATKFLLADVLVEKGKKSQEQALMFLQEKMENQMVKAVSMGNNYGVEGVRVYLDDKLVAKLMVENHKGTTGATYIEALHAPIPTTRRFPVEDLTPLDIAPDKINNIPWRSSVSACSHRSMLSDFTTHASPSIYLNVAAINDRPRYTVSYLPSNATPLVVVTDVHNGPARFVVVRKDPDAEKRKRLIKQYLKSHTETNLKQLENPMKGDPCIVVSGRDKEFHRALITAISDGNSRVYFVDQGFTEFVQNTHLIEISAELVSLELLAVRVELEGGKKLLEKDGVSSIFTNLALNKTFHCKVIGQPTAQVVALFNHEGRNVVELILEALNPRSVSRSSLTLDITNISVPALPNVHVRADLKVIPVDVEPEERLFVTYTGAPGELFGQFEKRPEKELKDLEAELASVYGDNGTSEFPLLYADVQSHIGDYGVIKWNADGNFYRVKITREDVNEVEIRFVDYGNKIKVPRRAIWAPVKSLKLFTQQPFGIQCFVSDVKGHDEKEWSRRLVDQTIHVRLGPGLDEVHPATFMDGFLSLTNKRISIDRRDSFLSPEAPEWVPTNIGNKAVVSDLSRKLTFETSSSHTDATPKVVSNSSAPAASQNMPGDSQTHSNGVTAATNVNVVAEPGRSRATSFSSMTSSVNQRPTNLDSVEKRLSPKRNLPISHPDAYFYPPQPNLNETTKNLEIVFVETPSSFYCQLSESIPPLDDLMEKLSASYADKSKQSLIGPKKDMACVANYTCDGAWYRGKVLRVEGSEVDVLFVDYGNQQRTPIDLVKAIDEEFTELPPQAYHCSLIGVLNKNWTPDDKSRLEASMGQTLTATFASQCDKGKFAVRLSQDGAVINDLFKTVIPSPEGTEFTTMPISARPIDVNVAWYYNTHRFFLSPPDLSSYQDDLDKLEAFYSPLSSNDMVEDQPKVGMPCVVKFKDDGLYYRSRILSIRGQIAEILFVDYGNEQDTPLRDLKRIHPQFMNCPQLTWQCQLKDVKVPTTTTPDMKKHIDNCFLTGKVLRALLHEPQDGVFQVHLDVPEIGDAAEYLIKNKVLKPIVEEKTTLPPQKLDYEAGGVLSTHAVLPFSMSPMEFWVQLEPDAVETIMAQLDELALQPEFISSKDFLPSIGTLCLAFVSDDYRWYRAIVKAVNGDTSTVYFIDYGNCSPVKNYHLKRIPANFAQQPAMAFKCCLDGALDFSNEIKDAFLAISFEIVATVNYVKTVEECLHVRLSTVDGEDVAEKIGLPSKSKGIEVFIPHAKSPINFWMHKKQDAGKLGELQNRLEVALSGPNAESCKIRDAPNLDQVYGVYHPEYLNYYRGQVKNLGSNQAQVNFIDYGDTHLVSFSNIYNIPNQLKELAPFAIHASLNLELSEKEMPEEVQKYFSAACNDDPVYLVSIGSKVGNVQLVDSMKKDNLDIADVLKNMVKSLRLQKAVEAIVDHLDSPSKSTKSIQASHVYPTIRSSTELITDADCFPGKLISSNALAVCLTSPSDVWLHLDPAAADALMARVKQFVNSSEFHSLPPFEPFFGCSCLAFCTDDATWYRANIESVQFDSVVVFYVDYGNSAPVGREHLRALPQSLVQKQPALALKCALDGADRNPLPNVGDCQSAIFNKKLSVTFAEKTEKHLFVRLRDETGTDLNNSLGLGLPARQINPTSAPIPAANRQPQVIPGAVPVAVSCVKSASIFWIQLKEKNDELEQIRNVLRPLDGNETVNAAALDVREGGLYAAMHPEYSRYYRARINKVHGDEVEAFFLDYGHTHWVPLANVRPCPSILTYIPAMATECTFRTPIYPDQYSEEIEKAFRDATEGVECQAVFSGPQPKTGVHYVESIYAKGINVADLLSNVIAASRNGNPDPFSNLPMYSNKQQRGL